MCACLNCGGDDGYGSGRVMDPQRRWWQFWKTIPCPACGGDGLSKPPGWPDEAEIARLRPEPPPPPPLNTGVPCPCCGLGKMTLISCREYASVSEVALCVSRKPKDTSNATGILRQN